METSLSQCGKRAMRSCLSIRIQTFTLQAKQLHVSGERKYSDAPPKFSTMCNPLTWWEQFRESTSHAIHGS